jgi:type IV pilus assembly protein PilV
MNQRISNLKAQSGVMLIEALVALLIFSVGILGIVGLQATAVKASTDAKYRSEAALLANELIGRIWTHNRADLATLQAAFADPNGTEYKKWAWEGAAAIAATKTAPGDGTVLKTLPNALLTLPTVTIAAGNPSSTPNNLVTIKIFWQAPNETTPVLHNYVTQAQIGG